MGFSSAVDDVDQALEQLWPARVTPTTLDLFRFNVESAGDPETADEFTTYTRYLSPGGSPVCDFLDRGEFAMSAGTVHGDGYQASHWRNAGSEGNAVGIMQPALGPGEIVPIGDADFVALDMIGWDYEPAAPSVFQAGDADQDLDFDQLDLVVVLNRSKYLTGRPATWGDGDWNGAQAGSSGDPPHGDGVFDRLDIVAALATGNYLQGPYSQLEGATTQRALRAAAFTSASGTAVAVSEPACAPMALSLVLLLFMTGKRGVAPFMR